MFTWLEEFYRIRRENRACHTCEVLRLENARLLIEQSKLLDRILEKPVEKVIEQERDLKPLLPNTISWNKRRQMLEAEDRRKAQLIQQQKISTEELEKELLVEEKEEKENAI